MELNLDRPGYTRLGDVLLKIALLVPVYIVSYIGVQYGFLILFFLLLFLSYKASSQGSALTFHYFAVAIYCSLNCYFHVEYEWSYWGGGVLPDSNYQFVLKLVIFYLAGVEVGSYSKDEYFGLKRTIGNVVGDFKLILISRNMLMAIGLCALIIVANYDMNFTPRGLLSSVGERPLDYLFGSILPKTLILSCFTVSVIFAFFNRSAHSILNVLAMAAISFFLVPFDATPRQVIIVALYPAVIILVGRFSLFFAGLIGFSGVVLVGPLLNYISRDSIYGEVSLAYPFSQDFDAGYIVAYLRESDLAGELLVGYGRYLSNAFSFFLPGELKPFSEFDPLQSYYGMMLSQTNVSLPPFFPAYLDFGYVGVFIFALIVGNVWKRIDGKFIGENNYGRFFVFLSLIASYTPFIRGPVMGWGMFFFSGVVSFYLVVKFSTRIR